MMIQTQAIKITSEIIVADLLFFAIPKRTSRASRVCLVRADFFDSFSNDTCGRIELYYH